jgi:hypothetical protein
VTILAGNNKEVKVKYTLQFNVTGEELLKRVQNTLREVQKEFKGMGGQSARLYAGTSGMAAMPRNMQAPNVKDFTRLGALPVNKLGKQMQTWLSAVEDIFDEQVIALQLSNKVIADHFKKLDNSIRKTGIKPINAKDYAMALSNALDEEVKRVSSVFDTVNESTMMALNKSTAKVKTVKGKPYNVYRLKQRLQEQMKEVLDMPEILFGIITDVSNVDEIEKIIGKNWNSDLQSLKKKIAKAIKLPNSVKHVLHDVAEVLKDVEVLRIGMGELGKSDMLTDILRIGQGMTQTNYQPFNMLVGLMAEYSRVSDLNKHERGGTAGSSLINQMFEKVEKSAKQLYMAENIAISDFATGEIANLTQQAQILYNNLDKLQVDIAKYANTEQLYKNINATFKPAIERMNEAMNRLRNKRHFHFVAATNTQFDNMLKQLEFKVQMPQLDDFTEEIFYMAKMQEDQVKSLDAFAKKLMKEYGHEFDLLVTPLEKTLNKRTAINIVKRKPLEINEANRILETIKPAEAIYSFKESTKVLRSMFEEIAKAPEDLAKKSDNVIQQYITTYREAVNQWAQSINQLFGKHKNFFKLRNFDINKVNSYLFGNLTKKVEEALNRKDFKEAAKYITAINKAMDEQEELLVKLIEKKAKRYQAPLENATTSEYSLGKIKHIMDKISIFKDMKTYFTKELDNINTLYMQMKTDLSERMIREFGAFDKLNKYFKEGKYDKVGTEAERIKTKLEQFINDINNKPLSKIADKYAKYFGIWADDLAKATEQQEAEIKEFLTQIAMGYKEFLASVQELGKIPFNAYAIGKEFGTGQYIKQAKEIYRRGFTRKTDKETFKQYIEKYLSETPFNYQAIAEEAIARGEVSAKQPSKDLGEMIAKKYAEKIVKSLSSGNWSKALTYVERLIPDYSKMGEQLIAKSFEELMSGVFTKNMQIPIENLRRYAEVSLTGTEEQLGSAIEELMSGLFGSTMDSARQTLKKMLGEGVQGDIEQYLKKMFKGMDIKQMLATYTKIASGDKELEELVSTTMASRYQKYKGQMVKTYAKFFEEWQQALIQTLQSKGAYNEKVGQIIKKTFGMRVQAIEQALDEELKNVMAETYKGIRQMATKMATSELIDKWKRASVELVMSALSVVMTFSIISANMERLAERFDKLENYAHSAQIMLRSFGDTLKSVFVDFLGDAERTMMQWAGSFGFELNDMARGVQDAIAQSDTLTEAWKKINVAAVYARATGSTFEQALKTVGAAMEGDVRSLKKFGRALGMTVTPTGKMDFDKQIPDRLIGLVSSMATKATYWANKLETAKMELGAKTDDFYDAMTISWSRGMTKFYEYVANSNNVFAKLARTFSTSWGVFIRALSASLSKFSGVLLSIYALMSISVTMIQYFKTTMNTMFVLIMNLFGKEGVTLAQAGKWFSKQFSMVAKMIASTILRGAEETKIAAMAARIKGMFAITAILGVIAFFIYKIRSMYNDAMEAKMRIQSTTEALSQAYKKYLGKIKSDDYAKIGEIVLDETMKSIVKGLKNINWSKINQYKTQITDLTKFAAGIESHNGNGITGTGGGKLGIKGTFNASENEYSGIYASLSKTEQMILGMEAAFEQLKTLQKDIANMSKAGLDYTAKYNKALSVVKQLRKFMVELQKSGHMPNIDIDTVIDEVTKALSPSKAMQTELGQLAATWEGLGDIQKKVEDNVKRAAQTADSLLSSLLGFAKDYADATNQFQKSATIEAMQTGLKYFQLFYKPEYKKMLERAKKYPILAKYVEIQEDMVIKIMQRTYYKSLGIWQDWSVKIGDYQNNMLSEWAKNLLKFNQKVGKEPDWKKIWEEIFGASNTTIDELLSTIKTDVSSIKDYAKDIAGHFKKDAQKTMGDVWEGLKTSISNGLKDAIGGSLRRLEAIMVTAILGNNVVKDKNGQPVKLDIKIDTKGATNIHERKENGTWNYKVEIHYSDNPIAGAYGH